VPGRALVGAWIIRGRGRVCVAAISRQTAGADDLLGLGSGRGVVTGVIEDGEPRLARGAVVGIGRL
jgi:hypothetical protein